MKNIQQFTAQTLSRTEMKNVTGGKITTGCFKDGHLVFETAKITDNPNAWCKNHGFEFGAWVQQQ